MNDVISISLVLNVASSGLILLGLYIIFTQKNLIKIVIGLGLADTGVNVLLVSTGYINGNTAPIFSNPELSVSHMVDPVPQALVLTSIVIGFGVSALALALIIKLFEKTGTLDTSKIRGLKW